MNVRFYKSAKFNATSEKSSLTVIFDVTPAEAGVQPWQWSPTGDRVLCSQPVVEPMTGPRPAPG
jgi:hypothetical protein